MEDSDIKRFARSFLRKEVRMIRKGRKANYAGVTNSTPVRILEDDSPPNLIGHPYLKTNFRKRGFSKILYTKSTLEIVIGREWYKNNY